MSAALLCALFIAMPARAEGDSRLRTAAANEVGSVRHVTASIRSLPWAVNMQAVPVDDLQSGDGLTQPRWGPRRGLTDASQRRPGNARLYAHVDLGADLPGRLRSLIGRPDGGVTFELRSSRSTVIGPTLGSMVRWRMSDGGQFSLRLRGGRLRMQYGTSF